MSMRKYGTSADQVVIPEEEDVAKTASVADRDQTLAEVRDEAKKQDEE